MIKREAFLHSLRARLLAEGVARDVVIGDNFFIAVRDEVTKVLEIDKYKPAAYHSLFKNMKAVVKSFNDDLNYQELMSIEAFERKLSNIQSNIAFTKALS